MFVDCLFNYLVELGFDVVICGDLWWVDEELLSYEEVLDFVGIW